ncbi:MSMEG_0567/Sll0786 family nitrogen starvation N-acetyltransferase [Leptolyngbya sp. AN02str]|uniref:MSMEG_0567/Sll0786 family nitrogen starvation N-acetyltransferase n=1 Tax=Leptolyngbya sp. AN02str TaxID=3423363 RepID=UPI003D312219
MTTDRYTFKLALSDGDVEAYFALRRAIFCEEQGIFDGSDEDETDRISYPIIAIDHQANSLAQRQVVGVVRIYEAEPGLWYGGRLGVHQDYRRVGRIGKGLIHKAVTTANTWGCDRFLATVQLQNVRFFQRLHWDSLEEIVLCDRPHHLMEADLAYYPPGNEPRPHLPHLIQAAS